MDGVRCLIVYIIKTNDDDIKSSSFVFIPKGGRNA